MKYIISIFLFNIWIYLAKSYSTQEECINQCDQFKEGVELQFCGTDNITHNTHY